MKVLRYIILIAVFTLFGLATVWQRLEIIRLGYEVHELERVTQRLREESRELEGRVAKLTGPEEVSRMAEELGLEPSVSLADGIE